MATFIYDNARNLFLNPQTALGSSSSTAVSWTTDTIAAVLVHVTGGPPNGYTAVQASDQFYTAIPTGSIIAGAITGTPVTLAGLTASAGIAGANPFTFPSVGGALTVEAIVIFKYTGAGATSPLICYIDSANASPLPVTPNTSNITITPATTGNKLFKL